MIIRGNEITFDADLVGPWVYERAGGRYVPGCCTAIGRIKDGKLVAGVTYSIFPGLGLVCGIAGEGRWANRSFLWLIFDYPFNRLGEGRITTLVSVENQKSQDFNLKLGFKNEALLEAAQGGKNVWVNRIFKNECKWIER